MSAARTLPLFLLLFAPLLAHAQTISFQTLPSDVGAGLQAATSTARLSSGQHGGITVTVASSDSTALRIAPDGDSPGEPSVDLFLPNGSTDARFVVQGVEGTTGRFAVEVSAPGFPTATDSVDVVTGVFELSGLTTSTDVPDVDDAFQVRVGVPGSSASSVGALQAARVGGGGLEATISVDDPTVAELVTSLTRGGLVTVAIPEGSIASASSVADGGVALDGIAAGTVTVTAQIPDLVGTDFATRSVTVDPAAVSFLAIPSRVGSGLVSPAARARLNGRSHGGVTVSITSSFPSRARLSLSAADTGRATIQAFVPDGETDVLFYVHGLENTSGLAPFTASAPGFGSVSDGTEIVAPAVEISGLGTGQDTLDPPDVFRARIGVSSTGTSITSLQAIRPGGVAVPVTFSVDDSTVAVVDAPAGRGGSVAVPIEVGEFQTPGTVGDGGVVLDGLDAGTVTVTATAPGLVTLPFGIRTVTVSQPAVTLIGFPERVGSGLRGSQLRARLGASAHGGTVVRVESTDSTKVLLSLASDEVGRGAVEGFVPDGSIDLRFYVHGVEGTTGTVDLNATASQFGPAQSTVDVLAPALELSGLSPSQDTIDDIDAFNARIGVANTFGSAVDLQPVRPGGTPIDVTFAVDDSSVAVLQTAAFAAGDVTLTIGPGGFQTPTSVNTGGLALDGIAPGAVVVSGRAPGVTPLASADRSVQVTEPSIAFVNTATRVGAGLQSSQLRARLSGRRHGGVTLRIESLDPSIALVSGGIDDPGQDFVEVFVPDGSIDAPFHAHGLEGVVDVARVVASTAIAFPDTTDVSVEQPGVQIGLIGSTYSLGDAVDAFRVELGLPAPDGSRVFSTQARRAGAPPLAVTVNSSEPTVGEIVSSAGSGSSQTVFVQPGDIFSPNTLAQGGVGLRPVGPGTSVITAAAPGFVQTGRAQREITVDTAGIVLSGVPVFLGEQLQSGLLAATLQDRFHGGVTLRIESSDSTRALVSTDPLVPGSPAIEIPLVNGTGTGQYVIQGVDGGSGPVTITATAGGESGSVALEIVEPALQIVLLADSLDVVEPEDPFVLQTGIAAATGDSLVQLQGVSAAVAPLDLSVVNEESSTGDLRTTASTADSVVVAVEAAQFQSAFTVSGGGVAFDPVLPGSTTVRVGALGFAATDRATRGLIVFGDPTSAPAAPTRLALEPNVPNPFNPSTTIRFALPNDTRVSLVVYDTRGRRVRTLVDGDLVAGTHDVTWTGRDDRGAAVGSGVYFVRLDAQGKALRQKMVLVE